MGNQIDKILKNIKLPEDEKTKIRSDKKSKGKRNIAKTKQKK